MDACLFIHTIFHFLHKAHHSANRLNFPRYHSSASQSLACPYNTRKNVPSALGAERQKSCILNITKKFAYFFKNLLTNQTACDTIKTTRTPVPFALRFALLVAPFRVKVLVCNENSCVAYLFSPFSPFNGYAFMPHGIKALFREGKKTPFKTAKIIHCERKYYSI